MILPKKLKILGRDFDIIRVNSRCKEVGYDCAGTVNTFYQKIWIDTSQGRDSLGETIIHEIVEAIRLMCDMKIEHSYLQTISNVLYQVLRDNNIIEIFELE